MLTHILPINDQKKNCCQDLQSLLWSSITLAKLEKKKVLELSSCVVFNGA